MQRRQKLTLGEMKGDLEIYFNWSANALFPFDPGAADVYLQINRDAIVSVAQRLLEMMRYIPEPIYRGVILKQPVETIMPHKRLQYLSFSTNRVVAEHFASVNGFGSNIMDVGTRLGYYGYVIEYMPNIKEILFHHHFLSVLPYAEGFSLINMDGTSEVKGLEEQKEIIIFQPIAPFTNISRLP